MHRTIGDEQRSHIFLAASTAMNQSQCLDRDKRGAHRTSARAAAPPKPRDEIRPGRCQRAYDPHVPTAKKKAARTVTLVAAISRTMGFTPDRGHAANPVLLRIDRAQTEKTEGRIRAFRFVPQHDQSRDQDQPWRKRPDARAILWRSSCKKQTRKWSCSRGARCRKLARGEE